MVDVDPTSSVSDPFCGIASYDGHDGTDIRVAQLLDTAVAGRVVAAAPGVVRAVRDGEPDRLVQTDADRQAVGERGCGNGVVIDHDGGLQTQYCHLAEGTISVGEGDQVAAGDYVGTIGLSGITQFPHLEFIVRRQDVVVDPFSGRTGGENAEGCDAAGEPLWADQSVTAAAARTTALIGVGFSSAPIEHDTLMMADPAGLFRGAEAIVAWAWAINVTAGDIFRIALSGPDGFSFIHESEPLTRTQAAYSIFAGQRSIAVPGEYTGTVQLVRGGEVVDAAVFNEVVE
ncbi:MAG: M23 family metallopeptidase [Pseudomonadota bacterium]